MNPSTKSALKFLLLGLAWLFFVAAAVAFWWGGRAISEFAKEERMIAEMEGIGLAAILGGLGAMAKIGAGRLEEGEIRDTSSLEQALPSKPRQVG